MRFICLQTLTASSKVVERRLNCSGHIERRDGKHLLQKMKDFEGLSQRKRGGPKRRWRDCVKIDMDDFGFTPEWQKIVQSGSEELHHERPWRGREKLEADDDDERGIYCKVKGSLLIRKWRLRT